MRTPRPPGQCAFLASNLLQASVRPAKSWLRVAVHLSLHNTFRSVSFEDMRSGLAAFDAQASHLNSASTVGPRDTNAYSISPAGIGHLHWLPVATSKVLPAVVGRCMAQRHRVSLLPGVLERGGRGEILQPQALRLCISATATPPSPWKLGRLSTQGWTSRSGV